MRLSAKTSGTCSFLSEIWLPLVMQCTPMSNSSLAVSSVRPNPPAAFSPLAITRSTAYRSTRRSSSLDSAWRPGLPIISPMKRILTGIFHCSRFSYDIYLDLAGIGHLGFNLFRNVAGHDHGRLVSDLITGNHDANLATGLDGK